LLQLQKNYIKDYFQNNEDYLQNYRYYLQNNEDYLQNYENRKQQALHKGLAVFYFHSTKKSAASIESIINYPLSIINC